MTILLQNLVARAPKPNDLGAVTKFLIASQIAEDGASYSVEEDVLAAWQRVGFNLQTDAWLIYTYKGQLVGYADVWSSAYVQIDMNVRVHPEFRGRGIGTLLLRLAEHRARQFVSKAPADLAVNVYSTASHLNQQARELLEHEGYVLSQQFWRVCIASEDSVDGVQQARMLTLDLFVDRQHLAGISQHQPGTGMYGAHQFDIYVKQLRAGKPQPVSEQLHLQTTCIE